MKSLKRADIEALRRELPVLEEEDQRMIVGGEDRGTWFILSGDYISWMDNYIKNTPDSTYVEQVIYKCYDGTVIVYQDSTATDSTSYIPNSERQFSPGKYYLPPFIYNSGHTSAIDSVIHTHKYNELPTSVDSLPKNHMPGVNQFIYHPNSGLVPY
jgi:hypothetical protein